MIHPAEPAVAISRSPITLKIVPSTIHGRRRPHLVDVRSDAQPTRIGTSNANTPPAAVALPTIRSLLCASINRIPVGNSAAVIGCQ